MTHKTPKTTPTGVPMELYPLRSPKVETDYNRTTEELQAKAEWEYMLDTGQTSTWTCNGFVPVTYLIMPPWLRMRGG